METLVIFLIFWGICGLVAALIFESRGHAWSSGCLLGFFFGPLGILIAAVTPPTQQVVQNQQRGLDSERLNRGELKKCPYCAELVKKEAVVCRYCGKDLPPDKPTAPPIEVALVFEDADITSQRIKFKDTSYPLEDITLATVEQTGSKFFVKVVTKDGRERNIGYSSNKQSVIKIADIIHRTRTEVIGQARQPDNTKTGDIQIPAPQQPMESTSSEKLDAAIKSIEAGDKTTAMRILAGVVTSDPKNEMAWFWLSKCVEEKDRKRYCLARILVINPNNQDARQELAQLEQPQPSPPTIIPPVPTSEEKARLWITRGFPRTKKEWTIIGALGAVVVIVFCIGGLVLVPGSIAGVVAWQTQGAGDLVVVGIPVKVWSADGTELIATAITDGSGNYKVTNIRPGRYLVSAYQKPSAVGTQIAWKCWVLENVEVWPGQTTPLSLSMDNALPAANRLSSMLCN